MANAIPCVRAFISEKDLSTAETIARGLWKAGIGLEDHFPYGGLSHVGFDHNQSGWLKWTEHPPPPYPFPSYGRTSGRLYVEKGRKQMATWSDISNTTQQWSQDIASTSPIPVPKCHLCPGKYNPLTKSVSHSILDSSLQGRNQGLSLIALPRLMSCKVAPVGKSRTLSTSDRQWVILSHRWCPWSLNH